MNFFKKLFFNEKKYQEYLEIVKKDGYALKYVPKKYRTEELCKIAVNQNGWVLYYVPEKYKTEEICKIAVQQDGYALESVPDEYITEELCKIAVQKKDMHYNVVR